MGSGTMFKPRNKRCYEIKKVKCKSLMMGEKREEELEPWKKQHANTQRGTPNSGKREENKKV